MQPTNAPTTHPTSQPTKHPTPKPTPAPTEHPCVDGSHGCDKSEGGICVQKPGGQFACKCAPSYKCVQGCDNGQSGHKCVATPAPTSIPTAQPTQQPTNAPTTHPTSQPTKHPTPKPTPAPTEHPCVDGSHGCDKSQGGICVQKPGGQFACKCAPSYKCVQGCDNDQSGHKCVATPAPTSIPTAQPTRQPTKHPTPRPTPAPTLQPLLGGVAPLYNDSLYTVHGQIPQEYHASEPNTPDSLFAGCYPDSPESVNLPVIPQPLMSLVPEEDMTSVKDWAGPLLNQGVKKCINECGRLGFKYAGRRYVTMFTKHFKKHKEAACACGSKASP